MKNKILKLLGISAFGFSAIIGTVSAATLDDLKDPFNLNPSEENTIGVSVTPEQLELAKDLDGDILLGYNSKTIATTSVYDASSNVIDVYEKEVTPLEEKMIENNNVHVFADGKLHDMSKELQTQSNYVRYETNSKKIEIMYYISGGNYRIQMSNNWKTNPKVHSFDIIATRWDNYKSTSDYWLGNSYESTVNGNQQNYTDSSNNLKKFNLGVGLSQNLFDNVAPLTNMLNVLSSSSFGTYVYGSYQHANRNVSLETSKSYTISSSGLGGVINQSYPSYYDGMQGVYTDRTI